MTPYYIIFMKIVGSSFHLFVLSDFVSSGSGLRSSDFLLAQLEAPLLHV